MNTPKPRSIYEAMNVAQLRAECKTRKMRRYSKAKRDDLIAMLEASDKARNALAAESPVPDEIARMRREGPFFEPTLRARFKKHVREVRAKRIKRNRAKARRRRLRAMGYQAGF